MALLSHHYGHCVEADLRQAGEEAARSVRRQLQEVRGEITAGERHWRAALATERRGSRR